MESERADGIVLRTQPVTESSLIVTWFTREFGKLKTMAKGARRIKGPFRGRIDLFYRDEIVFLRSRRSDLHLLHDCYLVDPRSRLRGSVSALAAAAYGCELVELATESEDPNERLFALLDGVLGELARKVSPVTMIWFELQVLAATGWKPKWGESPGVRRVLESLAGGTLAGVSRVRLTAAQVEQARAAVWMFWDRQVGQAPRSREWLAKNSGVDKVVETAIIARRR